MKILMLPDDTKLNAYQSELARELRQLGVSVYFRNFSLLPILRAFVDCGKPDILHLHWTDGFIVGESWVRTFAKSIRFLFELLAVKMSGVKVVWTIHNLSNHEGRRTQYEVTYNRFVLHLFDALIVHCNHAREAVVQTFQVSPRMTKRIRVIPHGNYVNCYENIVSRKIARRVFGYGDSEIVMLFFGALRPYKGLFELIRAFKEAKSEKLKLILAGQPASRQFASDVQRAAEGDPRIRIFLHLIPDEDIQKFMNASDVVVLPYSNILTSGTLLLAMSFGKAVIVPRLGCVPETVDDRGAIFYKLEDGLRGTIQKILSADLAAMGRYNKLKAQTYDWESIAAVTLGLYREVIS